LDQYDLLVTTYGTLHRDIAKLKDVHFDYAILDESQRSRMPNRNGPRPAGCLWPISAWP